MIDTSTLEHSELNSEELREQRTILGTLMKHPGWELLERFAHMQQAGYQQAALKPVRSMDEVPANEFTKGVAQGITEVLSLPAQLLETIQNELAVREARRPQTEGDGNDGHDDDS